MKIKLLFFIILLVSPLVCISQTNHVGINTKTPDPSAMLDIKSPVSGNKGVLVPRMTLAQKTAIASPANGLLVFQTDGASGFWYYNATLAQWLPLGSSGWSLSGNSGTTSAVNFVGTADNTDFYMKTNSKNALTIKNNGNVGIGTIAPTAKLHIDNGDTNYTEDFQGNPTLTASSLISPCITNSNGNVTYTQDFSSVSIGFLTKIATNNPYQIDNNTGVAGEEWQITNTGYTSSIPSYSLDFSNMSGNRALIKNSLQNQTQTLVIGPFRAASTKMEISFDYEFEDDAASSDNFNIKLHNSAGTAVATLVNKGTITRTTNETTYSNTITVEAGETYTLRFTYVAANDMGAQVDNIVINFPMLSTDSWVVSNNDYNASCTTCNDLSAVIGCGSATCAQNETFILGSYLNTVATNATVSFNYGFNYDDAGDEFEAVFWNDTDNVLVSTLVLNTTIDAINQTFTSGLIAVVPGKSYSVRFRYKGTDGKGAVVDNVVVSFKSPNSYKGIQITDTTEGLGKVLTSDATGIGTWQNLPASVTTDEDWKWVSGSSNTDVIYHEGTVNIGSATQTNYNLHVYSGTPANTRVRLGSVEEIRDAGVNKLQFSEGLVPITNNAGTLGNGTYRWKEIWAGDGVVNTSDGTLKEDIQPIHYGLKEVLQLKPVTFKWKQEKVNDFIVPDSKKKTQLGFIAQDLQRVLPEIVETHQWKESKENPEVLVKKEMERLGVSYSELIPVLIKAIQEQQQLIEQIKTTNTLLKDKIEKKNNK